MEFLRDILGQELYSQVEAKLKGNDKIQLANIAEGKHVDISKYNDQVTTNTNLQTQLLNIETTIKELLKDAKGDKLEDKIRNFQETIQEERKNQEKAHRELLLNTAIKLQLAGKVHNEDITLSQINKDQIVMDETGKIKSGLDDQIEGLQKSMPFLFVEKDKNSLAGVAPAEGIPNKRDEGNKKTDSSVDFVKELARRVNTETSVESPYFK